MSRAHADRLRGQGRARYDYAGRVVVLARLALGGVSDLGVERFGGEDARPDRAVLPPWPGALARMS